MEMQLHITQYLINYKKTNHKSRNSQYQLLSLEKINN